MKKTTVPLLTCGALLLMAGAVGVGMQYGFPGPAFAQNAPATAAPAKTPFDEHIAKAGPGLLSCAGLYSGLGRAATALGDYGVMSNWDDKDPSKGIKSIAGLALPMGATNVPGAAVVFAAPTKMGCSGNYVRIAPTPTNCTNIAGSMPNGAVSAPDVGGLRMFTAPTGAQTVLIPSGQDSCVVVTTVAASDPLKKK